MRPARLLGFLVVFLLSFFVFRNVVFAQTPATNTNPDVPNNLHAWTQTVMIEVASSLTCLISGVDPVNPNAPCLGVDTKTGKIGYVEHGGGAIGSMGALIAMTFTPPARTGDFVNYMAANFGIVKPAYAQGTGFESLSPLVSIWSAFRNMTYVLFVLVFIIIGFAIMLRVHIDPRTVMTIENQIPKLIIGLILVTFSFAIAGLLIDLMWVFLYLVYGVFSTIPGVTGLEGFNPTMLQGLNAVEAGNKLGGEGGGGVFGFATTITSNVLGVVFSALGLGGPLGGVFDGSIMNVFIHSVSAGVGLFIGIQGAQIPGSIIQFIPGVGEGTQLIKGGAAGAAAAAGTEIILRNLLPNLITYLIITFALLFSLFRLWFSLLKAYVMILIVIVFAPFWILAGLIPGSRLTFENLLRELGGNLVAFPATIVFFMLGKTFVEVFSKPNSKDIFVPPLIGNPGDPSSIGALVGFGIILLSADVVKLTRKVFKAPDFDFAAIYGALGASVGYVTRVPKEIGRTIKSSKEITVTGVDPLDKSKATYGEKGKTRAFLEGLTGRG